MGIFIVVSDNPGTHFTEKILGCRFIIWNQEMFTWTIFLRIGEMSAGFVFRKPLEDSRAENNKTAGPSRVFSDYEAFVLL